VRLTQNSTVASRGKFDLLGRRKISMLEARQRFQRLGEMFYPYNNWSNDLRRSRSKLRAKTIAIG